MLRERTAGTSSLKTIGRAKMADYHLGHSELELKRLMAQAEVLRPITERLLRSAGIQSGMRVLDLGCGAGDVTMLAAELVGAGGAVVGVDRAPEVIELAARRAKHAGFKNIAFRVGTEANGSDHRSYDIVVGRYVLIHQPDPVSFIRAALSFLRPGGVFALHEIDLRKTGETLPTASRVDAFIAEIMTAMRAVTHQPEAAGRLAELFIEAGAPCPSILCERPVAAGPKAPMYRWVALTVAAVRALARPNDGRRRSGSSRGGDRSRTGGSTISVRRTRPVLRVVQNRTLIKPSAKEHWQQCSLRL